MPLGFLLRTPEARVRKLREERLRSTWAFTEETAATSQTGELPGGSDSKASACSAGDPRSIPGLGRSPGERNGNPLQYSYLGNSMD